MDKDQALARRKRIVVIVYAVVFLSLFGLASAIRIQSKIEDARNAAETAPPASSSAVAPVASR